jgi:hypothetical protein
VLAAVIVLGIDLLPRSVFDVTMSVDARTVPAADGGDDGPRFIVSITPLERPGKGKGASAEGERSTFEIRSSRDELWAATTELVSYESNAVKLWRIPLELRRVQIGESLAENVIAADPSIARQPIMTQGNVRIFARRVFGGSNRYQVQEEHFDPADVVQIPGEGERGDSRLLGLLSLNGPERAFDLTLHTEFAKVFVRRLGAEHAIGASMWSIVSRDPASLALWAALVSLISIANYHSTRLNNKAKAAAAPPQRRWLAKRR